MNSIDARIGRILAIGTRIAVVLLAIGSVLLVAGGTSPLADGWPPLHLASLPADLLALQPAAFLWLGLIVTIATPVLRVVASTWGFGRAGEPRMAVLGVAVLVVLGLAVAAGLAVG
jgi:uncharacterized membrane protein